MLAPRNGRFRTTRVPLDLAKLAQADGFHLSLKSPGFDRNATITLETIEGNSVVLLVESRHFPLVKQGKPIPETNASIRGVYPQARPADHKDHNSELTD